MNLIVKCYQEIIPLKK